MGSQDYSTSDSSSSVTDEHLVRSAAEGHTGRANTQQVHTRVREAILMGELPAGMAISQVQLAKKLSVSRTPLREALRLLEREGLVDSELNHRVRVSEVSVPDLEQLYSIRIDLEALAIRLTVPRLTEEDFSKLVELHEQMVRLAESGDYKQWELCNRAFHKRLTKDSGERLVTMIDQLSDHAGRYRRLYQSKMPRAFAAGLQEHKEILDACEARDPILAADYLARHYAKVALNLITALTPEYDPVHLRTSLKMAVRDEEQNVGQ